MSGAVRVSVIIPCYEDGDYLLRAVASIDEAEPIEIIVVDDGSSDAVTAAALERITESGLATVLRQEQNQGVSAARNRALAEASGRYVMPLDADDLAIPGRIGEMANLLDADDGAAVAYGDYLEFGTRMLARSVPRRIDPFRVAYTNEYPPSALWRRRVLEELGGWRRAWEGLDSRSDWSLWMAAAEAGHSGAHLGDRFSYLYRLHGTRLQERGRVFHEQIYAALRKRHSTLFAELTSHRRASNMSWHRKIGYPKIYGRRALRTRRIEAFVKRSLDRAGLWTLQRPMEEDQVAEYEAEIARIEARAIEVFGPAPEPRPPAPSPPSAATPHRRLLAQQRPLIVIGSGRSGTALVTRIFEDLGFFMGARQDANHEALHFIRLNTWLMTQAGVSWHQPRDLGEALGDPVFLEAAITHFEAKMSGPAAINYLGWRGWIGTRSLGELDRLWGWKDPRNTYTLPAWLELFPDARVVHVVRHGVDVAASYWKIQNTRPSSRIAFLLQAASKRRYHLPTIVRELKTWRTGDDWNTKSDRLERFAEVDDAVALWDQFTVAARAQVEQLGARGHELRFEDLISEPHAKISELAEFCGVELSGAELERATRGIDAGRRYAYRSDAELVALAERQAAVLSSHGYQALPPTGNGTPASSAKQGVRADGGTGV